MTDSTAAQLLAELASVGDAVRGQSWTSGGLSSGNAELGQLAAADSPLSVLSDAGFGDVRALVSFLEQPLDQLAGNPSAVSSAAQHSLATGDDLSELADSYRASLAQQTTGWSGDAAESYRTTGTNYADEVAAIGQAAATVSSAISGAGGAVAQTAQDVRQDISDAAGQMLQILTTARAQAATTNGASLAQAIPQCVQIAESYGQRIAARMRALLSNGQNLEELVEQAIQLLNKVIQALRARTSGPTSGGKPPGGSSPGPGKTGSGPTNGQSSGPNSTQTSASTANQPAANPTSSGQTSSAPASSDQTSPSADASSVTAPSNAASTATGTADDTSGTTDPASLDSTAASSTPTTVPQSADSWTPTSSGLTAALTGSGDYATSGTTSRIGAVLGAAGFGASEAETGDGSASGSAATTESSASGATEGGMLGGPMASARGGKGPEDKERLSPPWLWDERGLFDPEEPPVPSVIDKPLGPEDDDYAMPPRRPKPVDKPRAAPPPEPVNEAPAATPPPAPTTDAPPPEPTTAEPPAEPPPPEPMTAEVLRRAAASKDAPPRLLRAADAVLEGKFTWEDVASGQSQHPLAQSLFTPKARENLWPMLREVATQLSKEPRKTPPPIRPTEPTEPAKETQR